MRIPGKHLDPKGKSKKKKLKSLAKLKKELWIVFSQYIRNRDGGKCFTCERTNLSGSNYHAGHFIKKSIGGLELYFHESNVNGQCAYCNLFLDGNQYEYGLRLGKKAKELLLLKGKTLSWDRKKFEEMIAYYKGK